eukprot:6210785-Pleurochrysis_carterae.AAC.5
MRARDSEALCSNQSLALLDPQRFLIATGARLHAMKEAPVSQSSSKDICPRSSGKGGTRRSHPASDQGEVATGMTLAHRM